MDLLHVTTNSNEQKAYQAAILGILLVVSAVRRCNRSRREKAGVNFYALAAVKKGDAENHQYDKVKPIMAPRVRLILPPAT